MKKKSGNHTSLIQVADKLLHDLLRLDSVNRISPGMIQSARAKSQSLKVKREGELSITVTVVGGGIQDLFIICERDVESAVEITIKEIELWAHKKGMQFRYRDGSNALMQ